MDPAVRPRLLRRRERSPSLHHLDSAGLVILLDRIAARGAGEDLVRLLARASVRRQVDETLLREAVRHYGATALEVAAQELGGPV